jgi:hypothetical protein
MKLAHERAQGNQNQAASRHKQEETTLHQ